MREVVAEFEKPVMLYSIGKDSSVMLHLAHEGVLSGEAAVSAAARRHDVEVPRDDRVSRRGWPTSCGLELIVHVNPEALAQGINPFTHGSARPHRHHEDAGAEAGAGQVRLRRGLRRRPPRRGEVAGQGAHLLVPLGAAPLGPEEPAPGAVAPLQHAQAQGREHPRLPAVELDRARRLAVHPPGEDPDRAALLSPACARWSSATAR